MPIWSHQEAFVKSKWNNTMNVTGELPPSHTSPSPTQVWHTKWMKHTQTHVYRGDKLGGDSALPKDSLKNSILWFLSICEGNSRFGRRWGVLRNLKAESFEVSSEWGNSLIWKVSIKKNEWALLLSHCNTRLEMAPRTEHFCCYLLFSLSDS